MATIFGGFYSFAQIVEDSGKSRDFEGNMGPVESIGECIEFRICMPY